MKSLKLCLMTLYHPIVVTEHIKRHRGEKKNWLPVIVLLVLTLAVRILSIYGTHYPLASVSVRKANLLLECGKLFVPVLTWVLASYMMTTILDGETLLSETLLFSAYALTPYIVFTPILTLASRIMDGSQIGLFATLEVGVGNGNAVTLLALEIERDLVTPARFHMPVHAVDGHVELAALKPGSLGNAESVGSGDRRIPGAGRVPRFGPL